MITATITCSMCGHIFDPNLHASCQNCPLKKNCSLVCCPQCGFEMINMQQSKLARFMARFISKSNSTGFQSVPNLAGVSPGQQARVVGFSDHIPADRQAHLLSYGLIPGRVIRVVQHSPVTIIQVEHTELALEREMAQQIQVEAP